jgi:hypothetical protein
VARPYEIKHSVTFVGTIAADSDAFRHTLLKTDRKIRIVNVYFSSSVAITAADTNYQTLQIKSGSVVICSIATGPAATGQSFAVATWYAGTLVTAAAANIVAAAGTVYLQPVKTGTGMAMTSVMVQVDYYDIDA